LSSARQDEIGVGLRRLDVVVHRPIVRELAGIEQIEPVVDLLLRRRAGEHHGEAALLQVDDQVPSAVERTSSKPG